MRPPFRALPLTLLWLVALWPLALLAVHWSSPLAAARTHLLLWSWLHTAGLVGGGAALVLALLFPPFPAGLRLVGHAALARLRADRGPLLRAQGELRSFETAARQLEAGRAAWSALDPQAALPHLVRAIELEPGLTAAHFLVGQALLRLGLHGQAAAPFAHVVAREPGHGFGEAQLLLGRCLMLAGDVRGAAEVLTRHRREHGGNRRSHYWLGICLRELGDRAGSRAMFAVAAAHPGKQRLTAEEGWFRARARVALWRPGPSDAAATTGGPA